MLREKNYDNWMEIKMINQVSRRQFTSGALWKIIESYSSKGITMLVSIVLARILMPLDYGVVALSCIFLNFSDILIDGGFSTTLIRKKNVDDCDYSCVLMVCISVATLLYCIFFFIAPTVASYYEEPIFCPVFRVLGLSVFIQAFASTRIAVVNRNMQFKFLCHCNIVSSVISGIIGIVAAYVGAGVWAIVFQRLLQNLLLTVLFFAKIKFKIRWLVRFDRLKEILKFSIGVVSASLLYFITNHMYGAVIGKKYSVIDLGFYSKGNQLPEQISLYTFSAVSGVLLPTISSYQDDLDRVKHIIRKVTSFSAYVIFPLMVGMMLISEELIVLLLTEKWKLAAPVMIGSCIYYIGMPFSLMNSQVYYALGHSFMKLKIEIIRFIMMFLGLVVGCFVLNCKISLLAIISGVIMVVTAIISAFEAGKMLSYSLKEMVHDVGKPMLCTMIMAVSIWGMGEYLSKFVVCEFLSLLAVKIMVGVIVYVASSIIFKPEGFAEIKIALLGIIHKNKT